MVAVGAGPLSRVLGTFWSLSQGGMQGPQAWLRVPLSPPPRASQIEVTAPAPLGSDNGHLLVALDSQSVFPRIMAKCGVKQR